MAMAVQTNMGAVTALKHLNTNQNQMNVHLERLSSGYRINSAADDAAGYAIAAKMEGDKGKLVAAQENAFSAQAMVKMADAGLNEITNVVKRLQVLATKAASGENGATELAKLNNEASTLLTTINKISANTTFNAINLIGSGASTVSAQVGIDASTNSQITLRLSANDSTSLTINAISLSSQTGGQAAITSLTTALDTLNTNRANLGADSNALGYLSASLGTAIEQTANSISAIKDTDMALEMAEFTKSKIMVQASTAMVSQANQASQNIMSLFR